MNHRELRRTFLEFYAQRGHKIVPSSSLIPKDDPTLLFTGAGMVQFKPYWAGTVEPSYRRACSVQKCLRASDLEQVGHTPRHCTFFEMLGNFSFGEYFKAEAIPWAWEYLTEVVKLDKERLAVSVFEEDDEAFDVWEKRVGLDKSRIFRLTAKDNFWGPVGGGGACGPCSEIYVDLGPEFGCGKATCGPGCDCDRFSEVYNVVFPQFNQLPDGSRVPLKNRGIDTGMGLERLAQVSQGKKTIFDTDLFAPLVRETARIIGLEPDESSRVMLNVAADHARALVFAITDGVLPSNEARGYVLRNILRRALLFAHRQDVREPFLYKVAGAVDEHMRQFYPELGEKREQAGMIIKAEEERFLRTLDDGLGLWQAALEQHRAAGVVPGGELFRLHDTYGFHVELVKELAKEAGVELDLAGFEAAMQEQRERSKKASAVTTACTAAETPAGVRFVGYERDEVETELVRSVPVDDPKLGRVYDVYLKDTPFYAEGGGQVGDTGRVTGPGFELEVFDTVYRQGVRVARAKTVKGEPQVGPVQATVDTERRREIERAHTATHLLHAALRKVVGDHVKQEGSLVEPGRLRFDFRAFEPLTDEQLGEVERLVYDRVLADTKLRVEVKGLDEARAAGALAFFGEQYGEEVRVVQVPGFSMELCGGTHLRSTGEIGMFRVVSETGVAAGIRRIEALAGRAAFERAGQEHGTLRTIRDTLGTGDDVLVQRVAGLLDETKRLAGRLEQLSAQLARNTGAELVQAAETVGTTRLVLGYLPHFDAAELRLVADRVRELATGTYCGLIAGSTSAGRMRYIVFVSPDLQVRLPAGKLAKIIGPALGGGGGGRPDLAEGGGLADNLVAGQTALRQTLAQIS